MADDSLNLLQEYVRSRSDETIRAVVRKHSAVVYATALRCLNGDRAAAQDVTQEVFLLLLRKASGLQGVLLSGWLYRQACRRAANHVRSERRRQHRERVAADHMESEMAQKEESPFLSRELDDALLSLPAADRDAVVLRFFEGMDFRSVGSALNISEEAARKRVKRALERLGEILKKRGTIVSGGSLEVALLGMECPPLPEPFLSTLTAKTAKSSAAIGGTSAAIAVLKPLLGGSLAASLIAGTAIAVTQPAAESEPTKPGALTERSTGRRTAANTSSLSPLESILEEIRRARTGPENSLTKLRLEVILDGIADDQIPEFIALAESTLSVTDQVAVYEPLLKRWARNDPTVSLDFIVRENVGERVDVASSTDLLNNVFSEWSRKDREASSAWLIGNWEKPALAKNAFFTELRIFLAMDIADSLFRNQGAGPFFQFIQTLPESARFEVLGVAAGDCQWLSATPELVPASRLLEFHRTLQGLPDGEEVRALTARFWKNVASRTNAIDELRSELTPMETFQVALGEMNVMSKRKSPGKPKVGGGPVSYERVTDHAERELAAMKAGEAAGLPRADILSAVGHTILESRNQERIDQWYAANGGGAEFDDVFAEMATEAAWAKGWSGDRLPEMVAIGLASRISDPERQRSLSRGAFLRLIARNPAAAKTFAEHEPLPADLSAELKSMLTGNP